MSIFSYTSCLLVLVNVLLMQNAGVLQQQIWATTTSVEEFLKENFFLSTAPVLQRGLKSCTQMFWSSSCASNLAALFSPQLYITLSWSLLLWKKSFRKTPGEQNTLSLNEAEGYTHQVYILSSCLYICLHFTSGPNPHILPVSILFPRLPLLEVIFCLIFSRL